MLGFFATISNCAVPGPRTFRRPASRFIFRILAVCLRHLPPWSAGGEIVFPSGPSRRETRTNHVGIVAGGCGVGRSGRLGFLAFFFYRQPTHAVSIYISPNRRWRTTADWWLGHLSRVQHTHTYIYIYNIQCLPVPPRPVVCSLAELWFSAELKRKVSISHHPSQPAIILYIYSVVHDFLPSNNNSSTFLVSGYESSCFLFFFFSHTNIYINCPLAAVHIRTNTKHIKTTMTPPGRERDREGGER